MPESFFQTFVLLLLVTDPFGNVPLFTSTLAGVAPERRARVVVRECLIAFFLLLVFMFGGRHFLGALQLTEWLYVAVISLVAVVWLAVLLAAERLQRVLGDAVMTAFERLRGLILTAIAIEMRLAGVRAYVASI